MSRFIHWSDLHVEYDFSRANPFEFPDFPKEVDALLLAGDTSVGAGHLDFLKKAWEKYEIPIISIWGNHEPYHHNYSDLEAEEDDRLKRLQKEGADIRILRGAATEVSGVAVIGSPLWTDFSYFLGREHIAKMVAAQNMKDFKNIRWGDENLTLTPDNMSLLHKEERFLLTGHLERYQNDTTVVMTHFGPSPSCVNPMSRRDILTAAFVANMEPEILEYVPNFWIYGHTHNGCETDIQTPKGTTRLRHNPRGYPHETCVFDLFRVIDTDNPERLFL